MTLILEYVLEGQNRGYNFTTPTRSYSDDVLKVIWRNAMPRGQGWGTYIGAESCKCFLLPDGRVVVSQITVTDAQDESGRRGIRRAVIEVISAAEYARVLRTALDALPVSIQRDADHNLREWRRIRALERLSNRIRKAKQLIFTHSYSTAADWRVVEAVLLRIALEPPHALRLFGASLSFTTLALEYREESMLVALPAEKAASISSLPTLQIT